MSTPIRGRPLRRRCVSCVETSQKARSCFSSPDRFLAPRAESIERESIFRVSKSPQSLSPGEREARQRDHNIDPFHTTSPSRSQDAIRERRSSPSGRQYPPHFTPSFVHGHDASPGPDDVLEPATGPRQISFGAVWRVGGPTVAQGGPRPGVNDGRGGLLASGTNGPMHTAHFLDRISPNQDIRQHEGRLALALEIDQASRVLGPLSRPPLIKSASTASPQLSPFSWQNNSWVREGGCDGSFSAFLMKHRMLIVDEVLSRNGATVLCDPFPHFPSAFSMLHDFGMTFTVPRWHILTHLEHWPWV
jgi:hypothetical protein